MQILLATPPKQASPTGLLNLTPGRDCIHRVALTLNQVWTHGEVREHGLTPTSLLHTELLVSDTDHFFTHSHTLVGGLCWSGA